MAVTYVKDFNFPSDFGFHKNGSASVPGKKNGGKVTTPYRYRDGGKVQPPQSKFAGHTSKSDAHPKTGAGAKDLVRKTGSDHMFAGTRSEKTSGKQPPAFKHGGSCKCSMCGGGMVKRADGGEVATGKVKDGTKKPWNPNDAVSPGSYKRTPPKQGEKNASAAKSKFAAEGENREPATKQVGDVERMSGFSDFKRGGKVKKRADGGSAMDPGERKAMHRDRPRNMGDNPQAGGKDSKPSSTPYDFRKGGMMKKASGGLADRYEESDGSTGKSDKTSERKDTSGTEAKARGDGEAYKNGGRIANLGKYAHGGKVNAEKYEKAAGTPKTKHEPRGEAKSGKALGKHTMAAQGTRKTNGAAPRGDVRLAGGGLTRAASPKRNAAIHAKGNKHSGPALGALAAMLGAGPGGAMKQPGGPPTPPGMAPGMGSPPGGQMGGMAPPPGGAMGPGGMSHGGGVKHVVVHHVSHKM